MQRFTCQSCGNEVDFRSRSCVKCRLRLGFVPEALTMSALIQSEQGWTAMATPGVRRFCANQDAVGCNWMIPVDQTTGYCAACTHNRVVPDLALFSPGVTPAQERWRVVETAKRQMFWSVLRWGLPHPVWSADPVAGLGFDVLSDPQGDVLSGHKDGIITLTLAEADPSELQRRRVSMNETYRTLLGHFRHEIGHYYWDRLVRDGGRIDRFRALFGDETADYGQSLETHYRAGPPPDWAQRHNSAYASSHPWEDFAETWAHWTHMVDGLETVQSYALWPGPGGPLTDPYGNRDAPSVIDAWVP